MTRESEGVRPPTERTDAEVVACVLAGDREAYRILVRRYQDPLYRQALRMTRHPDTATDMVQSAFVKAFSGLRQCRDPERFGAWVYRILTNRCRDHLKSPRRKDASLDETPAIPVTATRGDPAEELERSEMRDLLEGAIARVPEPQRQAFVMKHVEGRSYDEMAELLGASVSALKMRVHRARQMLQETLREAL